MEYVYPNQYLWDVPRSWNKGSPPLPMRMRALFMAKHMGIDPDTIIQSPFGRKMIDNMAFYVKYEDDMDPELLKEYEEMGLKKQQFERENYYTRWDLFTPVSMDRPENAGRKYPLLLISHGAEMPMEWEECSGFLPLCARDEVIAVAAQDHRVENLLRILEIVKADYPVDESRIYATGYSQGGSQTSALTIGHPELFACSLPGGNNLFYGDRFITDEMIAHVRGYDLPVMLVNGQMEGPFPLHQLSHEPGSGRKMGVSPLADEDPTLPTLWSDLGAPGEDVSPFDNAMKLLNRRLASARCRQMTAEEILATKDSPDEVIRAHGIPYDRTEVREILGVKHFIGDLKNEDGNYYLRIATVDRQGHWPPCTMPELMWEFMKRFSLDPVTKELIVAK